MVQAILSYQTSGGQFYWNNRIQSNLTAAWWNPGDGWQIGCVETWGRRWTCQGDLPHPDQVWRLVGTLNSATNTPTATPQPTSTSSRTPTNTRTNSPTITPTSTYTPAALLVGHVTWQGHGTQPNMLQVQPLTLTLASGVTQVSFPGYQVTDASGFFTVNVSTLPQGTYNWRVKGPDYLSSSGSVALSAGISNAEMGMQRVGDLNGDNVCNAQDFTLLKGNFGQSGAPPLTPNRTAAGNSLSSADQNARYEAQPYPLAPVPLVLDDGSTENSFGMNINYAGFPVLSLNRFTPSPSDFPMVLNQISIQFPDPIMANRDLTGLNIDLLVYEDPSGSGDPRNASKVYQHTFTI